MQSMHNLGVVLCKQGKLPEARELLEKCLELRKQAHGPEHRNTVSTTCSLAEVMHLQGFSAEAEVLYWSALRYQEKKLGETHMLTLISIHQLGLTLQALGKLEDARGMLERSLRGRRQTLSDAHPATQESREALESLNAQLADQGSKEGGLRTSIEVGAAAREMEQLEIKS
jgi:tetratricopeptide (TPR) repeat protein